MSEYIMASLNTRLARHRQKQIRPKISAMQELKEYLIERDGAKCQRCGKENLMGADCTVDHIIPIALGGPTSKLNCQILCYSCNQEKNFEEDMPEIQQRKKFMNAKILLTVGPFVILDIREKRWRKRKPDMVK